METTSHNRVKYSPSWTLTLTHYCRNTCGYCVFVERTGSRARLLPIAAAGREIEATRATELLIMSGEGVEGSPGIRCALRGQGFSSYIDYLVCISRAALRRVSRGGSVGQRCAVYA